jgi:hypothetical protein
MTAIKNQLAKGGGSYMLACQYRTVATAVEEAVAYGLANRDLEGLTHIGIDEISRTEFLLQYDLTGLVYAMQLKTRFRQINSQHFKLAFFAILLHGSPCFYFDVFLTLTSWLN